MNDIEEINKRIDELSKRLEWLIDVVTLSPSQQIAKRKRKAANE